MPRSRQRSSVCWALPALGILAFTSCTPGNLGESTTGWSPATANDGVVYVASQKGELKALIDNGFDGVETKWTFSGPENQLQGVYNPPVVGRNLLYFSGHGEEDGTLFAIDKESGTLGGRGWSSTIGSSGDKKRDHLVSGPAVDETIGIVVVGSEDGKLYAYDSDTGVELWQFAAEDKIWSSPVIDGNTVYFGSHDNNIYAVNVKTGAEKWRFSTEGTVVAKPLVSRGMVFIGSFDRKFYALDADSGNEIWKFEGASNWYWAGAVASNSAIFAASMDGNVYALDLAGNLLWQHSMGSPIVSTPALLPSGLVVASRGGKISLLNRIPGDIGLAREISSLSIAPADIRASIFALPVGEHNLSQTGIQSTGDDQRESVFIGARDGTVRRIQIKSGQTLVWCFDMEEGDACK